MSDQEILDYIAGDPAGGLAIAIEKYGKQLRGRLRARASERGYGNVNVDDVVQDCFLALLDPRKRWSLTSRRDPKILPWLTKRGGWGLQDYHDKSSSELRESDATVPGPEEISPLVAARVPTRDDEALVREAWARLSEKDRVLLTWRYGESYSEAEIAIVLGCTLAAAKKALHDARQRFKRHLTDLGYQP